MFDLTSPAAGGLILGLSAGLSPGPLLTLMLGETLRHGVRAGLFVAVVPLCTDAPIILMVALLHWLLPDSRTLAMLLGGSGGAYLLWLAWKGLRPTPCPVTQSHPTAIPSLKKAMLVNLLNPNPYIFWATIGVPTMRELRQTSMLSATMFLVLFYLLLVGSKALLAILAGRGASILHRQSYTILLKTLSLLLGAQGLWFVIGAITLWKTPA